MLKVFASLSVGIFVALPALSQDIGTSLSTGAKAAVEAASTEVNATTDKAAGILNKAAAAITKAPSFTLKGIDGKEYSLDEFAGKTVVLEWFNEGCPFVAKHYSGGNMQSLQKEYTGKGVVWLAIVSSAPGKQGNKTPDEHKATLAKWNAAPTALLIDEDGVVGKKYGAKTTPHMFVIDSTGSIAYAGAIDDKASTEAEDIPTSKNYVKAALDALLAGKKVEVSETQAYGCGVKYAL